MRILYFSYIETNSGWGAECFVDDSLRKLGHNVISIDFKKHENDLADRVCEAGDFDVVFLQRGDWFPKELLKAFNRPIVFWASELVLRCRDQDRLLYSGLFDYIFVHSITCEKIVATINLFFRKKTTVKCLLNGYDSSLHRKIEGAEKNIDVLFIGSITERRRKILDKLRNKVTVCEGVFGEDFVKMINSSKIVINIHSSSRKDTETRVFEVLGCGSFLLSEPLSEENPFVSNEHYVECSLDEFEDKIEYYLRNNKEREEIAQKGHIEALSRHSYFERTKNDIVPVLEMVRSNQDSQSFPSIDYVKLDVFKKKYFSKQKKMMREIQNKIFRRYQSAWNKLVDLYNR